MDLIVFTTVTTSNHFAYHFLLLIYHFLTPQKDPYVILRTGAPHPLPNFNGCGRTRRTRSSCAPGTYKKIEFTQADKQTD